MTFQIDLQNKEQILFLYSTTPPRANIEQERLESAAARLARRANGMALNGVVVYDVQEEGERTDDPRPFPFRPSIESQAYAHHLRAAVRAPLITYKCIAGMSECEWKRWLCDAGAMGIEAVSVVGLASSRMKQPGITLTRALEIATEYAPQLALGGVVIPERHIRQNECDRLLKKADLGCQYFISQAIYDPDLTIRLLRDYARACGEIGVEPKRIFLTFAPCGSEKTLEFMRWLGIQIPEATARRILTADAPAAESVSVCVENFQRIQEAVVELSIPLGVNVESVSARKDESQGAQELHHALYHLTPI
ncbi:MAG: methylenetetrahydrofolate reductase [Capsulimonas sp.]|uniref:methylenetetrahydrofolate reductase n=1 Tax=Capsulimonas sp. TaxID=2494211 RepID=UPI00326385F3